MNVFRPRHRLDIGVVAPLARDPDLSRRRVLATGAAAGLGLPLTSVGKIGGVTWALIVVVGDYGRADWNLSGASADRTLALSMAQQLGAAPARTLVLFDQDATLWGIQQAWGRLQKGAGSHDSVWAYFSGHGRQIEAQVPGARCSEGFVSFDHHLLLDASIRTTLHGMSQRVRRVWMLSDLCHAGGLSKGQGVNSPDGTDRRSALEGSAREGPRPKWFPGRVNARPADQPAPVACGVAVNVPNTFKIPGASPPRWSHLAAAADNEVAWSWPTGSQATTVWHRALAQALGREVWNVDALRAAAQVELDKLSRRQTQVVDGAEVLM